MGTRIKLNPQSLIHLKYSSVVDPSEGLGLGKKKSKTLKPLHCGNLFFAFCTSASASEPERPIAAVASPDVTIKSLLFISYFFDRPSISHFIVSNTLCEPLRLGVFVAREL